MSHYPQARKKVSAKDWLILGKNESHIQQVIHSIAQKSSEAEKVEQRKTGTSGSEKHVRFNLPPEPESAPEPNLKPFDACEHTRDIMSKWKNERAALLNDLSVLDTLKSNKRAVFRRRAKSESIKHAAQEKTKRKEHFTFMSHLHEGLEKKLYEFEQDESDEMAKKKTEDKNTALNQNLTEKYIREFKELYLRPTRLISLSNFTPKIKVGQDATAARKNFAEHESQFLDYFNFKAKNKIPESETEES